VGWAVNAFKRLVEGLDPVLHERGRLAIVSVLAAAPSLTFTELRDTLEMTDGNLSVHLQKLEGANYVAISKQFVGRRPQTTCRLTPAGREAFGRYLDHLEAIVRQGRAPRTGA
jgi:DNA-binding MarR family transcriptional regulator